ncbi:hypothetical protein P5673_028240 [Acropora cervicornis]|uniref:Uncharacterized protein n=1 Tax=Acropora cervicornis TaxID=6130 RepID=A0AAD9PY41_ACRCE|nr:hypothetical protein P5673_028240 [Acropora cervicornis]
MLYLRREIFQETMSLKVVYLVLLLSVVTNLGECSPLKYELRDTLKPQRTHRLMSRGKAVYVADCANCLQDCDFIINRSFTESSNIYA